MDANKKGSERCPLIRKGKHRVLAFVFFLIYFAVLFYFLFFSEEMGRTYSERAYHYNLIPFHEIMRFVKYRHVLGWQAVVLNIRGNIIAFMPFGSFLPMRWYSAYRSIRYAGQAARPAGRVGNNGIP